MQPRRWSCSKQRPRLCQPTGPHIHHKWNTTSPSLARRSGGPGNAQKGLSSEANARRAPHRPPSGGVPLGNKRPKPHQTA
eukprot:6132171-Amphidinium_carterae.1